MKKEIIDNMRKAMGTLPEQQPKKNYDYVSAFDDGASQVELLDCPTNPYLLLVEMSTSTWGNAALGKENNTMSKWNRLSPEARYIVALSTLTGNTLPVPMESISMLWQFSSISRHTFDQFVRMRIGSGTSSVGCRDNNKLDAPWILYPELYDELQKNDQLKKQFDEWTVKTKDMYEAILLSGKGSWQTARAVLPMSYSHSWKSYITLATLKSQCAQRLAFCEEANICIIFWKMRNILAKKYPLIGNYLRPKCDWAKRCTYSGQHEGLTKYFSSLFAGCGRWPDETEYNEFNFSCTNPDEFKKHIQIIEKDEWINYTENDFDKLSDIDKELFSKNI